MGQAGRWGLRVRYRLGDTGRTPTGGKNRAAKFVPLPPFFVCPLRADWRQVYQPRSAWITKRLPAADAGGITESRPEKTLPDRSVPEEGAQMRVVQTRGRVTDPLRFSLQIGGFLCNPCTDASSTDRNRPVPPSPESWGRSLDCGACDDRFRRRCRSRVTGGCR